MNIFYISIFSLLFLVFLYFGYKDDYNRDKISFKTGIVNIIGALVIIFCFTQFYIVVKTPIENSVKNYYIKQLGWNKQLTNINPNDSKFEKQLQEAIYQNNVLKQKTENWLTILESLCYLLAALTIFKFNKLVKRYFINQASKKP